MMNDSRQWSFLADMNQSGAITISDVWLWFKWLFFYPGDWIFKHILLGLGSGNFFEISNNSYGGFFSGLISFTVWVIIPLTILYDYNNPINKESKRFWPILILVGVAFYYLASFMDKHGL